MSQTLEKSLSNLIAKDWRIEQVIALDWYDGPLEGICQIADPPCSLFFELLAEQCPFGANSPRLFRLSELAEGSTKRILEALGVMAPPRTPLWAPHGELSEHALNNVQEVTVRVREAATRMALAVRSRDMLTIDEVWRLVDIDE